MKYVIILMFIPLLLFSQDPLNYYPHHVGDIWQYYDYDNDIGYSGYWNKTLIKDSLDLEGNHHLIFNIESPLKSNY